MKKNDWLFLLFGTLLLSLLFMFPYLSNDLSLEHDTLFHLSRIEGLAQSFSSGKLFPDISPLKNDGFGYASSLFYCDLFLVPAAIIYLAGFTVAIGWKVTVFLFTWLSGFSMAYLLKKVNRNRWACLFASALYLFSNYRITDVYVRGALGEVIAMAFLPFVLLGFYELFVQDESKTTSLVIGFTGIALSHNLTLLLAGIGFVLLMALYYRQISTYRMKKLILAALWTLGLSAWYLFPMLEHTTFQQYYLHYYATHSDLSSHTLMSWQYLMNETIFGFSGNEHAVSQTMVVTPGIALLFLPSLMMFDIHSEKDASRTFTLRCILLGFFFAFLCSDLVPWEYLSFLKIIQFPWRWMTLACVFLSLGAADAVFKVLHKQKFLIGLIFAGILFNSLYLLSPVLQRTLVIHNDTTYEQLLDGSIIDPYYGSSNYNRIEVAGADYLPIGYLDYKNASHCIIDTGGNIITCDIQNDKTMFFQAKENIDIIIPLTAYKGYHIYSENEEIPWQTMKGRISFNTGHHTEFTVIYEKTAMHKISILLSILTVIIMMLYLIQKKKMGSH